MNYVANTTEFDYENAHRVNGKAYVANRQKGWCR